MSERATEVTYIRGQVNGDHPTQNKIVKSTMFWKLDEGQEARSDRAALDFRLKLVFISLLGLGGQRALKQWSVLKVNQAFSCSCLRRDRVEELPWRSGVTLLPLYLCLYHFTLVSRLSHILSWFKNMREINFATTFKAVGHGSQSPETLSRWLNIYKKTLVLTDLISNWET